MHSPARYSALAASLLLLVTAVDAVQARTVKSGIYQNPPKIYRDDAGRPSGFFVSLMDSIAARENLEIEYVPCAWNECLARLERGELDLMPDVAYSAEREERFAFGREAVFASWSLVYQRPGAGLRSVLDLHERRIAVLADSVQYHVLKQVAASFDVKPQFVQVPDFDSGYDLVENGQVDGVAVNRFYGKLHEGTRAVEPTAIFVAPSLVKFAGAKDQRELLERIDHQLVAMKADPDSAYHRAFSDWFEPEGVVELPGWIKWLLLGGVILVIVMAVATLLFRRLVHLRTSELAQSRDHLEKLSYYDALTGLPNRTLFVERLAAATRQPGDADPRLAVLFVDLDDFKQINDSLGHEIGDDVLKQAAHRFTDCMRDRDTVARLGGDEFTVLLHAPRDAAHAGAVAEKLIAALKEPFQVQNHSFYLTASIGISLQPRDGNSAQALLKNADAAMYSAKTQGPNHYRFYTQELTRQATERIDLVARIREGLENGEFIAHYQPIFDLASGELVAVEALARWQRPNHGLVSPDTFIPLAEESGSIMALGEQILRQACTQMVEWQRAGIAPARVAVNLSGRQIQRGDIVDTVKRVLKDSGCAASRLELEVTESFVMGAPEQSIPVLHALTDLGLTLALDDFGTGHSSLAYLRRLPISTLKIDRSFIHDVPVDSGDVEIAQAIIALGTILGLRVIAEGIESDEQLDFLKKAGCGEGQGFLIGRPLPEDELTKRLIGQEAERASSLPFVEP